MRTYCETRRIPLLLADGITAEKRPGTNCNTIVVGPPGCGKTFSYMLPNILKSTECSMVIDDKKGNLYRETSEYFRELGYRVLKFDLVNFNGNLSYNPLEFLETKEDFVRLANYLVPENGAFADRIWTQTARQLCVSLLALAKNGPEEEFNLGTILALLEVVGTKEEGEGIARDAIDDLIEEYKDSPYYKMGMDNYAQLKDSAARTWKSVVISLRADLLQYQLPQLLKCMESNTIELDSIGFEKTVIYVVTSDTDTSLYPVAQLLYKDILNQLFVAADKRCDLNDNMLPLHVRFFIDDFASGVQQRDFENVIANCRSRNVSYMLAFQSIAQLEAIYGGLTEVIMDCADYKVFYGTTGYGTANYISEMSNQPVWEIQNMPLDKVCLICRGERARICKRVQTCKLPEYRKATTRACDTGRRSYLPFS